MLSHNGSADRIATAACKHVPVWEANVTKAAYGTGAIAMRSGCDSVMLYHVTSVYHLSPCLVIAVYIASVPLLY